MKYYVLSHITRILLSKLRKYHQKDEQLLVFSKDFIGEEIFSFGVYERAEIQIITNILDFNTYQHTMLDVGANIGNHAVYFSNIFNKVICYEVNPYIFSVLKINTCSKKNIEINNWGLSNTTRSGFLSIPENNFGGASVVDTKGENTISVELKKGDDYIEDAFALIKIDIEGHEVMALKGLGLSISKNKPIICFELIKRSKLDIEIIDLLKEMGYSRFFIPYSKSLFSKKSQKSFIENFIDGLFFKTKHQLKEINSFHAPFYNMIICEHPSSNYKIKSEFIKK